MTQASCPMSSIGTVSFCSLVSWQKFPINEWTIFTHVCSFKMLWFTGAIYGMRIWFSVLTTKGVKNGSMTGFMSSVILVQLFWKSLSFFWSDDSVLCGDLFNSRKWIGKKSVEKKSINSKTENIVLNLRWLYAQVWCFCLALCDFRQCPRLPYHRYVNAGKKS